ncbi:MAG: hypothetical protein ICV83_27990 [Cytophagales bacterium]|nr:hypothetical protein [Cytophagales bacterium]
MSTTPSTAMPDAPLRRRGKGRRRAVAGVLSLLLAWVVADLAWPVQSDIRSFDYRAIARMDTRMWQSYYARERVTLFGQLARLLREQYGAPFLRSHLIAYYAARAAFLFKDGHSRPEYEKALPPLTRLYAQINRMSREPIDADRAARLELEWWIVHRQRQFHHPGDLEWALARTAAAIYHQPAEAMLPHARYRAAAMHIRDTKAVNGGLQAEDWRQIEALLLNSWRKLWEAVQDGRQENEK